MQYPIDTYKAEAAKTFASVLTMFSTCSNGWQAGNTFDALLEYVVRNPSAHSASAALATTALGLWESNQGSMCWYDDYAWWGIASTKAFDARYAAIFGEYRDQFRAIALGCWNLLRTGKPDAGAYRYLGAPNVWENRDERGQPGYFSSADGWAVPRFPGGVWQYDMWFGTRTDPPECTPNEDQAGGRLSDPKTGECGLGPYQNTVVNVLYLELALRLALHGQGGDTPGAAATELGFLHCWFLSEGEGLLDTFADGGVLIRERVPTYAALHAAFPSVEGFAPESAWTGDQGLLLGGLVDKLTVFPADPHNADDEALALSLVTGVLIHLATDQGIPPASEGFNQGDVGDYCCGSGVFWRYLLYGFEHNAKVRQEVMTLVAANPDGNAVYVSAQHASKPSCGGQNPMYDASNALATLTAAIEILGP